MTAWQSFCEGIARIGEGWGVVPALIVAALCFAYIQNKNINLDRDIHTAMFKDDDIIPDEDDDELT